jgi:hypothetical protein
MDEARIRDMVDFQAQTHDQAQHPETEARMQGAVDGGRMVHGNGVVERHPQYRHDRDRS